MLLKKETENRYGYDPEKVGKTSTKFCVLECDYCKKIFQRTIRERNRGLKKVPLDACSNNECRSKKLREVYHNFTVSRIEDVNKKREATCLKRFGVRNAAKAQEKKEKYKKTVLEKYGVDHFSKTPIFAKRIKLDFDEIKSRAFKKGYDVLFSQEDYAGHRNFYSFRCIKHNREFETSVFNLSFEHLQCPLCNAGSSGLEKQIFEYIKGLGVKCEENNRSASPPYELDIYVPKYRFAVEFHGLYWHSEAGREKGLHYKKFQAAESNFIKLIQFYEDEWREKRDICKSMIRVNLGLVSSRKFARKLVVDSNNKADVKEFFEKNHLAGNTRALKYFSLRDKTGEIFCAISLRRSFTRGNGDTIEIARLATKRNLVVVGGFSRLMKQVKVWCRENGVKMILTYSDCRYSRGDVYKQYGFQFKGHTGVGYDYTNFSKRFNRFKFRAKNGKTERQVAKEVDVLRIYNAGNYRWELHV